ncbi:MAG: alpha/beta hydrolase domain-containing protein [Chloroflexota bacterium]
MAVARIEINRRQPYAGGRLFGTVGGYERIDGTLHFAADPDHVANSGIVDLDLAPRDVAGRVEFSADVCILRPEKAGAGNGRLLFEVVNRGRKLCPRYFNYAKADPATDVDIDAGDGFLMNRGWTVVWTGWQCDSPRGAALMGLTAPIAQENGHPLRGRLTAEFQPSESVSYLGLANRGHQPYSAADLNDPDAVLTVRNHRWGPKQTIDRGSWQFARDEAGVAVPSDAHIRLDGGFQAGKLYEVAYTTNVSPVVGVSMLAVRDTASFLRFATAAEGNPTAGQIERAYAFGISQSGRFLRHFLYTGLNLDEAGRQVYDGIIPQVAGARRGEFNHRFGQTSVQSAPNFGHLPPFDYGSLLARQRALGGVPRIFATNTAAEYWRGDGSLAHTDLAGTHDLDLPREVRSYLFASTQHGAGSVPLANVNAGDGSVGANWFNAVDYSPLVRAALVNLDAWVSDGVEPPASAYPRLADGTAVRAGDVLSGYKGLPRLNLADPALVPTINHLDLGPDADRGIGGYPVVEGAAYQTYVSAVDADGNETAGVRMPDVTVPLATYTGWNPRGPSTGEPGQILSMQGTTLRFAADAADREQTGDPRPSIAERYANREEYLARVRAAAEALVEQRYLLAEDLDTAVSLAAERWDYFTSDRAPAEPPTAESRATVLLRQ